MSEETNEKNFENTKIVFVKRPIEEIIEDSKNIDHIKVGTEVLSWVISNVENFIDNHNKIFKLDLVMDNSKEMEETKKLQDLYRAIPEDEENNEINIDKAEKCRRILDEITLRAYEHIKGSKNMLKLLFDRMVYYYETVIMNPENKRRALAIDEDLKELFKQKEGAKEEDKAKIQDKIVEKIKEGEKLVKFTELEGSASITNFNYDAFSVGVQIKEGSNPNAEEHREKKILKEYTIEEGFTVWVEINFKHKQRPTVMF